MVALASDWRIAEQRAYRFLSPARVVQRYRQIVDSQSESPVRPVSYQQMLSAIVSHAADDQPRPERRNAVLMNVERIGAISSCPYP
jgi:hypothetical protein